MKRMLKRVLLAAGIMGVIIVATATTVNSVEQPGYTLIEDHGAIEVREYGPTIVARVRTKGDRREAVSRGFGPLARYIFTDDRPEGKIAMTAPVTQEREGDEWVVEFVMPSKWSMDTLPKPGNPNVTLVEKPGFKAVAIRFAGRPKDTDVSMHEEKLRAFITEKGMKVAGSALYAYYDAPFVPDPLRRNEVIIPIQ